MNIKLLLSVFAITAFCHASAEVLVLWENDHLGGIDVSTAAGEAPSAGFWHADLAAAPVLSRGAGGTETTYVNTFAMRNADSLSLAEAIENNRYVTFSLEAQSGKAMNLTNIVARLQAQDATNYEVYFALMSDATGFSDGDQFTTWIVGGTGNSSDWLGQVRTFDLSGVAELQNVAGVEFRIYVYGHQGGAFAQAGIGRAFQTNGDADLRVEGEIVEGGDDDEVAMLSITVSPSQAVITWSEPPAGYQTVVWWMPYLDAERIDWVELASDLPTSQTTFIDTLQHNETYGFYLTESAVEGP